MAAVFFRLNTLTVQFVRGKIGLVASCHWQLGAWRVGLNANTEYLFCGIVA